MAEGHFLWENHAQKIENREKIAFYHDSWFSAPFLISYEKITRPKSRNGSTWWFLPNHKCKLEITKPFVISKTRLWFWENHGKNTPLKNFKPVFLTEISMKTNSDKNNSLFYLFFSLLSILNLKFWWNSHDLSILWIYCCWTINSKTNVANL